MTDSHLPRRTLLRYGAYGAGAAALAGTAASWDRLTGADIPGRDDGSLVVATLGSAFDPATVDALTKGFHRLHPDIPLRVNAVQAVDWSDFFAKILTQIAAGTAPDLVYVATEGVQLFAQRLGVALDRWVRRDAAELREYFADVHPSLVESMMYEGNLYQLPMEFNAADMYLNKQVLKRAGAEFPAADWSRDDFTALLRQLKRGGGSHFTPYFWTNRLWGGVVPWLFANDTNLLKESKAPGGSWLWDTFYPAADRKGRGGGFRWTTPQATADRVEEAYDYLASLVQEDLCTRPEGGNGNNLVGVFSTGHVGVTPAGGFWAGGLQLAGMSGHRLRRAVLPALAHPAPPVRRGGLRAAAHLEEAGSRVGVHQVRGPQGHHDPAVQEQPDHPGPAFDAERGPLRRERPGALAGLLRHPRPVSRHRPDPRAAAGRRGDRRPAQVHRHRAGLAACGGSRAAPDAGRPGAGHGA
jgi:multiple sugar transport system substrate-binding protein